MSITWGFMKFKADAEKCYEEVQTLDEITPESVLDLARDKGTELHKCFDWNDSSAAEKWRKQQARFVCQSFTVVIEHEESEPKSFRLIQHDDDRKAYVPVTFTVRNDDAYASLLKQAKAELASFKNRYKKIVELESVIDAIEEVLYQ